MHRRYRLAVLQLGIVALCTAWGQAHAADCKAMRKINVGVSVTPPNVVHTTPFVAKALGLFAKHCIDANIIQFEGGASPAARAAVAQGTAIANLSDIAIGRGMKAKQFWNFAPRLPPVYAVAPQIKTVADLKGKRLSASGGGVGGFQWRMAREVLRTANLTVDDVQFISQGTAGRLPGLVTGQIDAVALHPEDMHLAMKRRPGVHALVDLDKLLPNFVYNAYGASTAWIAKDYDLLRDTAAAMIEADRVIYRDEAKVIPIMVKATRKPKEAVEFAWKHLTEHCIWAVNEGFDPKRTQWTIDYDVSVGDLDKAHKPTVDQVIDFKLAKDALAAAGGPVTINGCKD